MSSDLLDFIEDCKSRGLTKHSVETYLSNIRVLLRYVGDPLKVDSNILRDFLNYLKFNMEFKTGRVIKKGVTNSTLNAYFSAISTYYDYLIYTEKTNNNPTLQFRRRYLANKRNYNGDNSRQLISLEQMRQLINMEMPIQHKLILMILAKTGIRRGELISIDIENINLDKMEITLKPKAKRTNRLVFFDAETVPVFKLFLAWRSPRAKENSLFISDFGYRIRKDRPNDIIAEYGKILGVHDPSGSLNKKLTPHCFRHFFTTIMRKNNMPREFIQELRGDRRRDAIDIYDHIDPRELKEMFLECVPELLDSQVGLNIRDVLPQPKQSLTIKAKEKLQLLPKLKKLPGEFPANSGETPANPKEKILYCPYNLPAYGVVTLLILSLLKDNPGLTPLQITRQLNRKYHTINSNLNKNLRKRYIERTEGKYSITPAGVVVLDVIKKGMRSEPSDTVKPADPSKDLLNYVLANHPDIVNRFINKNDSQAVSV